MRCTERTTLRIDNNLKTRIRLLAIKNNFSMNKMFIYLLEPGYRSYVERYEKDYEFKMNIMVIRAEKLTNYTKIDTTYLEDKNISLKAKGLLTLMLSLPDAWNFNTNGLRLLCKESRLAITNALKELDKNRYLIIEKGHSKDGKFLYNYIVYEKQYTQKVQTEQPYMDN